MTDVELCEAMELLGVSAQDITGVKHAPMLEQAQVELERLQARATQNLKKAAKFLHPDVNGGDAEKTRIFKNLVQVAQDLAKTEIRSVRLVPRRTVSISAILHGTAGVQYTVCYGSDWRI
jgi:hypothetical protein